MPTPQEMANLHPENSDLWNWLESPTTSTRDIQKYIHLIAYQSYPRNRQFPLAKIALDVRMADQASESSEKLSGQTDRLIGGVRDLVVVAEEQKNLAQKLERQTNKLILLTWALVFFSITLLAIAVVQTRVMLKENAQTNVQRVESGQSKQTPTEKKQF